MKKIKIGRRDYEDVEVIVDDDDYDKVNKYHWCFGGSVVGYKKHERRTGQRLILIHRLIMNPEDCSVVDHINHNRLDNRKKNLRVCSKKQNARNCLKPKGKHTSIYKGVRYKNDHGRRKRWNAHIKYNYRQIFIGTYKTEKEAAKAYNDKATELFGEYAYLNNI